MLQVVGGTSGNHGAYLRDQVNLGAWAPNVGAHPLGENEELCSGYAVYYTIHTNRSFTPFLLPPSTAKPFGTT